MNIINEYLELVKGNKWKEALPLIKKIVLMNDKISTSWFNYGVCLEALNLDQDAVHAFLKAYEIDSTDYQCQYRIFRSYSRTNDNDGFYNFLEKEYRRTPEVIELLQNEELFKEIIKDKRFEKYTKRKIGF